MTERSKYLNLLYDHYGEWKQANFQVDVPAEREVFRREIERLGLLEKARILEVGFGEGHFLDWGRDQGFEVEGIEISSEYVKAARGRGHNVVQGTIEDLSASENWQYDAIVSFDVLEHLDVKEIISFFVTVKPMLAADGWFLARFPNGGSPFGRFYQHGDATHRTALTRPMIGQLAALAGFNVVGSYSSARPVGLGRLWGLRQRLKNGLAVMIERALSDLYFAGQEPMGPNLTVHIRHRGKPSEHPTR